MQGIRKNDKHAHILLARKESEIVRNNIDVFKTRDAETA
jgi:hypothetical protein